jgi:hypothetical protein
MSDERSGDQSGELHESPLSPADDERIRHLLAEARHTEPMPADVVDRLDRVLTGLNRERSERSGRDAVPAGAVVDLAARRRRTAANLLVAAAAVVAVGVGLSQVPGLGGNGADSPTAVSADQAEAGGGGTADEGDSSRGVAQPESSPEMPTDGGAAQSHAFRIRSATFGPDVRKIRDDVLLGRGPAPLLDYPKATCLPAGTEDSTVVAASYDGAPAALVLRPPAGDVQVVDLYLCGDTDPRRSITLTVP